MSDQQDNPDISPVSLEMQKLNTREAAHRNASDPIPIEVIESWLKGEYLVGITQSTGYQYIGWSLMLRGFYMYKNEIDNKIAHWGYCYIDLKDGDLVYAGLRIQSGDLWGTEYQEKTYHPIYWRSVFSKFVGLETEEPPRLYFAYVASRFDRDPSANNAKFFEDYLNQNAKASLRDTERERLQNIDKFWDEALNKALQQNEFPQIPSHPRLEHFRTVVLDYLADKGRFDADMALLESLKPLDEILGLVTVRLDSVGGDSFKAQLYPLKTFDKTGEFTFTRLPHPI